MIPASIMAFISEPRSRKHRDILRLCPLYGVPLFHKAIDNLHWSYEQPHWVKKMAFVISMNVAALARCLSDDPVIREREIRTQSAFAAGEVFVVEG